MEPKTIDDFILELQAVSPEKRKLPLVITAPNGLQFEPVIKMQTKDFIPIIAGGEVEKMVISY